VSADEPKEPTGEQRVVLEKLCALLRAFGTANDAQDHDAEDEARRLRLDASAGIRDLMREHPFVAALYPSLGPELESQHIEGWGWSSLVDAVEGRLGTVHVELIPWDRVAGFRGRGTDIPEWITQLTTDAHAEAEQRLLECLVHENRVTQATPLALRLILGALRFGLVRDPGAVRGILERIAAAVRFQLEAGTRSGASATPADWTLFREERLWPSFESEARDEILRREWNPSEEEVLGWALLTQRVIDDHGRFAPPAGPTPTSRGPG